MRTHPGTSGVTFTQWWREKNWHDLDQQQEFIEKLRFDSGECSIWQVLWVSSHSVNVRMSEVRLWLSTSESWKMLILFLLAYKKTCLKSWHFLTVAYKNSWKESVQFPASQHRIPAVRRGTSDRVRSHTDTQPGPSSLASRGAQPGWNWSPFWCSLCPLDQLEVSEKDSPSQTQHLHLFSFTANGCHFLMDLRALL